MNCKHCKKPIVLVPSAKQRAEKYGGKPSDYARLFEYHSHCVLEMREQSTREFMRRIKG